MTSRCRPKRVIVASIAALAFGVSAHQTFTSVAYGQPSRQERHQATPLWQQALEAGARKEIAGDRLRDRGDQEEARRAYREALRHYFRAIKQAPNQPEPYQRAGRMAIALESHKEAIAILSLGHARIPADRDIHRYFGLALFVSGRKELAVKHLEEVAAQGSPPIDVLLALSEYYVGRRLWPKAIRYLTALIEQQDRAVYRIQLADCYEAERKFREVLQTLNSLRGKQPAHVWRLRGRAHYELGEFDAAVQGYQNYKAQLPPAERYRAYLSLSEALRRNGQLGDAGRTARDLIRAKPKQAWGYQQLGLVLLTERKWQDAVRPLERATALAPDSPWPYMLHSRALRHSGKLEQALVASKRAVALSKDPQILNELGIVYRKLSQNDKALAVHRRLSPLSPLYRVELAHDLVAAGEPAKAIAVYEDVRRDNLDGAAIRLGLAAANFNLALAEVRAGKTADARTHLDRALVLRPGSCPAHVAHAALALDEGNLDRAAGHLQQCGSELPAAGRHVSGRLMMAQGDYAGAARELAQAARQATTADRPNVVSDWAVALVRSGQAAEAVQLLEKEASAGDAQTQRNRALARLKYAELLMERRKFRAAREQLKYSELAELKGGLSKRVALLSALAQLAVGQRDAYAHVTRLSRDPGISEILAPDLGRTGPTMLRAMAAVYSQHGLQRAQAVLGRIARRSSGRVKRLAQTLHDAAALEDVRSLYRAGRVRRALGVAMLGKGEVVLEHDQACAAFVAGQRADARATFTRLVDRVPEAKVNLALTSQKKGGDQLALYRAFRSYLPKAGEHAGVVLRWIAAKERIWGLEPEASREARRSQASQ